MNTLNNYIKEALKNSFEINEEWMKEKYNEFNKIYFDNELPSSKRIELKYEKLPKNTLGFQGFKEPFFYTKSYMKNGRYIMLNRQYIPIKNIFEIGPNIKLNSLLNATENQWEDTLIHEMVHLYTYKDALAPKQAHGKEFRAKCDWIRRKAKEKYGKDYELEIYAKREDEFELKDEIKNKINKSNKYAGVVGVFLEMDKKVKFSQYPHQYRFFFCKESNYDKIVKDIIEYEKDNLIGIYKSLNTCKEVFEKYDNFPIVRTYKYWDANQYSGIMSILKIGDNLLKSNESKKEYIKPEMEVYEIPANINLSEIDLENVLNEIIKNIKIEDDSNISKENEKNMIEVK